TCKPSPRTSDRFRHHVAPRFRALSSRRRRAIRRLDRDRYTRWSMKPILRVALSVPLDRLFDYASNGVDAAPGARVLVPFGRRDVVGVAVDYVDETDLAPDRLKPATRALDA